LFVHIPVESMVYSQQDAYYQALNESTLKTDSVPFIEFMLTAISKACAADTPQDNPQVSPQVIKLLRVIKVEMSREQLQGVLKLRKVKFRVIFIFSSTDCCISVYLN